MQLKMRIRDRLLWGLVIGGGVVENVLQESSRAYHRDELFSWTPIGYSRAKYRNLMGRLSREGYVQRALIKGQVHYRITGAGKRKLSALYPVLKTGRKKWDGFWRVVMFEIPERKRNDRDALRNYLDKAGYGRLQSSVYLSAYDYDKSLIDFIQVRGLMGQVLMLEAKQKHLGNPRDVAEKVWQLSKVRQGYENLIDKLGTRFGIKSKSKRRDFIKRAYQDCLEVVSQDPFLPDELLTKEWPQEKAFVYVLRSKVVGD